MDARDLLKSFAWACLTSAQVGARLGDPGINPKANTTRARVDGRILGAWDGEQYLYPRFQFEESGQPLPALGELMRVLPRDRDGSVGLDAALWCFAPDDTLDGRSPAEVFPIDPWRVVELADTRRGLGDDARD